MISIVILSKDRPAQLRLLLDSLDVNGRGLFGVPIVIGKGASADPDAWKGSWYWQEGDFEEDVRDALDHCGELMCFMCDDGILYRPPGYLYDLDDPEILCYSLRLGTNTTVQYPTGIKQVPPDLTPYRWENERGDFGYPGSVDGHVFRTGDVRTMLDRLEFPNPTALECALVIGCAELADRRPLMEYRGRSSYVGVPVNRTSDQSGVRYGTEHPATVDECLDLWRTGLRIDLDSLDFSQVNGAHAELRFVWTADDRRAALHV